MKPMHKGVGLLISNRTRTRFFIQQKDEQYPYPVWRGCCSYWGGAIEEDDANELAAVDRELEEEIPESLTILSKLEKINIGRFKVPTDNSTFWLTVFEVLVTDKQLDEIPKIKVLEGRGVLFSREEALQQTWIWNTDFIFHDHLQSE